MNKRLKLTSLFAILLVTALVLSGCNMFGGTSNGGGKEVLNLILRDEPPNLDSAKSTDVISFTLLNNVMEGLYRVGKDGNPVLGLAAADPQVSPDKKTYTFKLRDAKWSDGKPVTAHDFEYAWKRALDPKTASEYAYILYPVKNAEAYNMGKAKADDVGVKALDDKTLQVTLEQPIPYFLDLLTFPTYLPQRQDIVEKYGDKYALEAKNMVFDGPFVLTSWVHNQSLSAKKNDNYWDKNTVKLQQVNWQIVKDGATQINLYNTGKVDFTYLPTEFTDKYRNNPDIFTIKESSSWYLEMNQTEKLFQNEKIREAVSLAIDKKTMTDKVEKNGSIPAGGIVPPDIKASGLDDKKKYREINPDKVQYDPAKAKQLWQEGLKELGMTQDQVPPLHLLGDDGTGAKKDLAYMQDQLQRNLGAKIVIDSVPFKERLEREKHQQFDIAYSGWGADYNDPMTYLDLFTSDNSFNRGKWSNKEFDQLIAKSKQNPDFKQRFYDLSKAEQILINQDHGIAPLYYRTRLGLKKPKIKDWYWHTIGPEYSLKWAYVQE
jgi:oligopeptide transport system substrate-binding protein